MSEVMDELFEKVENDPISQLSTMLFGPPVVEPGDVSRIIEFARLYIYHVEITKFDWAQELSLQNLVHEIVRLENEKGTD